MAYTIKELSFLLGVVEKTCLRWVEAGLKTVPGKKRPILIRGSDLKEFLRLKDSKSKVTLGRNEFYCLTCKRATFAKRGTIQVSRRKKNALCRVCSGRITKII